MPCGKGEYQPHVHNTNECFRCARRDTVADIYNLATPAPLLAGAGECYSCAACRCLQMISPAPTSAPGIPPCFLSCADGTYAPEMGMSECLPCPLPVCAATVSKCFSTPNDAGVHGIPIDLTYHAANQIVCRDAAADDPCDLHSYCLSNSATCPDPTRSPMVVAGLDVASDVLHTSLSSNAATHVPRGSNRQPTSNSFMLLHDEQ